LNSFFIFEAFLIQAFCDSARFATQRTLVLFCLFRLHLFVVCGNFGDWGNE